jgi:hypothetical protein
LIDKETASSASWVGEEVNEGSRIQGFEGSSEELKNKRINP